MTQPTIDPVSFVETALEHLPADPAGVTGEDLHLAAAISRGNARHIERTIEETRDLALRVLSGECDDETLEARRRLYARWERCQAAAELLAPYLEAVVEATGRTDLDVVHPDDEPINHKESK